MGRASIGRILGRAELKKADAELAKQGVPRLQRAAALSPDKATREKAFNRQFARQEMDRSGTDPFEAAIEGARDIVDPIDYTP